MNIPVILVFFKVWINKFSFTNENMKSALENSVLTDKFKETFFGDQVLKIIGNPT